MLRPRNIKILQYKVWVDYQSSLARQTSEKTEHRFFFQIVPIPRLLRSPCKINAAFDSILVRGTTSLKIPTNLEAVVSHSNCHICEGLSVWAALAFRPFRLSVPGPPGFVLCLTSTLVGSTFTKLLPRVQPILWTRLRPNSFLASFRVVSIDSCRSSEFSKVKSSKIERKKDGLKHCSASVIFLRNEERVKRSRCYGIPRAEFGC